MGCLELKTVLLSSKLTAIKKYAFNNTKIKNLYVPRGVKTGAITFKKGKYKKGSYKIKLKIYVKGNKAYKAKTINITVKVKFK